MKVTCLYCDKEYETKRETSCYCSNSCRTGAYKLRKKNKQIKAARQKAAEVQKDIDDKKKRDDEELRKEKAEKRRKKKEEKELKAAQKNAQETISQQNPVQVEPSVTAQEELTQPEKFETKKDPPKYQQTSKFHKKFDKKDSTKIDFWKIIQEIRENYKNKK